VLFCIHGNNKKKKKYNIFQPLLLDSSNFYLLFMFIIELIQYIDYVPLV